MPDAARISDFHVCPHPGAPPHVGGPIHSGSANVIVGFLPAAREGDSIVCFPLGPADRIKQGSTTVLINSRQAARRTDPGSHISGDMIAAGLPTVIIGDSPQCFTMRDAARRGTPFCEECERRRDDFDDHDDSAAPRPPDPETATLDDDEPPPGARSGRDALADVDASKHELAGAGEDMPHERMSARFAVAYQFYAAHIGTLKPSQILSHIKGIDLSRAVEVLSVAEQTLYQHCIPGAGLGQYFTLDPKTTPEQLGCSSSAYPMVDGQPRPPPVTRETRPVQFGDEPALALKSTSASIDDDWSYKEKDKPVEKVVHCPGGGTQLMIPRKFHPPVGK
ncbi:PAAR domain-containing protein [Nannocystis radixulma]|uniref:PAAR domain-containing protein n=1 Tax=Nannocystis radixulma TaxID=2995305 RepID=A0ABT5B1Q9_9BACT|nr:PAAR domain-containing protein [Nannocystis radixulma]MDC0668041.1 PAAR domain-containing protein [Nannocystis radixulma]